MIKVAIVDDHKLLVEGIAAFINNSTFAEVRGYAFTANDCLNNLNFWKPDILLMDVSLPDRSGIELSAKIKELYSNIKIIALTTHKEYSVVKQLLDNGVKGYLIKSAMSEEVLAAIQTVHNGEQFLCHEVDLLLKLPQHENIWLTNREKEVLLLISDGLTNNEIADRLFLSSETVRSYRKNLLYKLCAKNTAILIKKSIELKLI